MFRSWWGSLYRKLIIVCLVLIIIISFGVSKKEVEGYDDDDDKLGFIITRHVNSAASNKVWKMCINQLRKFYKHEKIIIIDDNSNYDFITDDDVDLTNCKIINSEFKKRGELLPYYYFYKNKQWFRRAVFIHDSVFINDKIPEFITNNKSYSGSGIQFLWYFDGGDSENAENIERLLNCLNHRESLIARFRDKTRWKGCWGVMSVIEYDFLKQIFDKYDMVRLLDHVQCREDRMAMERVFGILCIQENPNLLVNPSIFGHYATNQNNRKSMNYNYDEYVEDIKNNQMNSKINKLFFGR